MPDLLLINSEAGAILDEYTICDHCGCEIPVAEANEAGHLGYGTLCNECYALELNRQGDQKDAG